MNLGLHQVALLFLYGSPLGHAANLKAAMPPPQIGNLRGLQDANSTELANFTIPDTNGTFAEGMSSSSEEGIDRDICCDDKPTKLIFQMTGGSCAESTNTQGTNKFSCSGDAGSSPFQVTIQNSAKFAAGNFNQQTFASGVNFTIVPRNGNFASNTKFLIGAQELNVHTSCSAPLELGASFGALTLVGPTPDCAAFCVNDMPGADQDTGCSAFTPLCDGEPEESGEACFLCINNKLRGLQDTGCTEDCKICVADDDAFGDECKVCEDDQDGGARDSGCPLETPLCVPDDDNSGYGGECALCINDPLLSVAPGCPDDRPVCDADESSYGYECLVCVEDSNSEVDPGCDLDNPICNGGSGCFKCQNNESSGQDTGCTGNPDCPFCVAPSGGYGTDCAFCINDQSGEGVDTGCDATSPLCVADCDEGGTLCAPCINDQPFDEIDTGCTADAPLCDADFGKPGEECVEVPEPVPVTTTTTTPATTPATTTTTTPATMTTTTATTTTTCTLNSGAICTVNDDCCEGLCIGLPNSSKVCAPSCGDATEPFAVCTGVISLGNCGGDCQNICIAVCPCGASGTYSGNNLCNSPGSSFCAQLTPNVNPCCDCNCAAYCGGN